jgi:5-methylcytosine-specific restriction endonuclease McrA
MASRWPVVAQTERMAAIRRHVRRNSGRPWRRVRDQVYAEEYLCWRCGKPVDKLLPANHDMGKSVDHIVPWSLGGTDDRDNLRLAHRICNSVGNHVGPGVTVRSEREERHEDEPRPDVRSRIW